MAYATSTPEQNAAALEHFIYLPVSQDMIAYLAHKASQVIRCEGQSSSQRTQPITPPTTPPQSAVDDQSIPSLEQFITNLVERSHVQVPTLMTSLVFLARLRQRLPPVAKGMRCTGHRIFLAALILAAKNLNDSSPKNKHWARYTAVPGYDHFGFGLTEVNLMEKQMLGLLEWDLRVTETDLYHHLEPFLAPIRVWQARQAEKQRLRDDMLALERRQLALAAEQQQRVAAASAYHESPRSYAPATSNDSYYYPNSSRGSSRAPSRTPSLSPPTRSQSSASQSSYDSPSSPASVSSASTGAYSYHQHSRNASSVSNLSRSDLLHKPLPPVMPQQHHYYPQRGLPLEQTDSGLAPAVTTTAAVPLLKKASSNIFSRFLPSMSRPQHPTVVVHGY